MHNSTKKIVDYCKANNVSKVVVGYNKEWKQNVNLRKSTNQNFVQIPYLMFINQLKYKLELEGISILITQEAYTSKCSALDLEPIKKHETYLGKRVKRGLFKSANGTLYNSDCNGSANIGRLAFGDDYLTTNTGYVNYPLKVNPLKTAIPLG
jgi:putative transposase